MSVGSSVAKPKETVPKKSRWLEFAGFFFSLREMMHFSWIFEAFLLHPEGREECVSRGVKALEDAGGNRGWK